MPMTECCAAYRLHILGCGLGEVDSARYCRGVLGYLVPTVVRGNTDRWCKLDLQGVYLVSQQVLIDTSLQVENAGQWNKVHLSPRRASFPTCIL
jgi:hypothetical protein